MALPLLQSDQHQLKDIAIRQQRSLFEKTPNPFENKAPRGAYETVKMIIVGCTLFPIRLTLFLTLWTLMIIICKIATAGGGGQMRNDRGTLKHDEPFKGWRRIVLIPCPWIMRGCLWCVGFWRLHITDRRKPGETPANIVVVAPHTSMFDGMISACLFPPLPSEVGKIELVQGAMGAMMGAVGVASQGIFLDRTNKDSRQSCKDAIAARADPNQWSGPPTLICPEGTCTNAACLIQFKAGPFAPGKPVQPIALKYPYKHLNMGWTGDFALGIGGMLNLMARMMLQFANHCEVEIMEPYHPSAEEIADDKLFANNVRQKMADMLGVPVTEHSYADNALSLKAITGHVANDFVVGDVTRRLGVTDAELVDLLKSFKTVDKDRSGLISFQEFSKYMGEHCDEYIKNPRILQHMFELFETDNSGGISYRELVQALSMLSSDTSSSGKIQLVFLLCDPREDGVLDKQTLLKALEFVKVENAAEKVEELGDKIPDEITFEKFKELATEYPVLVDRMLRNIPGYDFVNKQPEKSEKPEQNGAADAEKGEKERDVELGKDPQHTEAQS